MKIKKAETGSISMMLQSGEMQFELLDFRGKVFESVPLYPYPLHLHLLFVAVHKFRFALECA